MARLSLRKRNEKKGIKPTAAFSRVQASLRRIRTRLRLNQYQVTIAERQQIETLLESAIVVESTQAQIAMGMKWSESFMMSPTKDTLAKVISLIQKAGNQRAPKRAAPPIIIRRDGQILDTRMPEAKNQQIQNFRR